MHETLSKKLKEYRSRHNLTQKELAARLFVSDKAISKWERGVSQIKGYQKNNLCLPACKGFYN